MSGSSASDGSWTSAATARPLRSIVVTARSCVGDRLVDVAAVGVDPALAVAEPVDDLERGVVQRLGDSVAQRDARVERERACAPRRRGRSGVRSTPARNASGTSGERDQEEHPRRPSSDRVATWSADDGCEQEHQRERAGDVDGAERPSLRVDARRHRWARMTTIQTRTTTTTIDPTSVTMVVAGIGAVADRDRARRAAVAPRRRRSRRRARRARFRAIAAMPPTATSHTVAPAQASRRGRRGSGRRRRRRRGSRARSRSSRPTGCRPRSAPR